MGKDDSLRVIIALDLNVEQVECLVEVLKCQMSHWLDYCERF